MAIAIDASSPIRWTGTPADDTDITSASFTPPAGSLMVCCVSADSGASNGITITVSDTQAETWTERVERDWDAASDAGHASIFTATATAAVARTCGVQRSTGDGGSDRISVKLYVVTGQHATPIGNVGEGGSATNDITPTIFTSSADNSFAFVCATDWNQNGLLTSSDLTEESADYSSQISVLSGYKDCGTSGSETANINAGGTGGTELNWVALEVIAAVVAGGQPAVKRMGGVKFGHRLGSGIW